MMTSLFVTALLLMSGASYVGAAKYVAEVYFVVEPQVMRNYTNLGYSKSDAEKQVLGDIDFVLYQVNEIYKSLKRYGLDVQVRKKAYKILDTEMFEECKLVRKVYLQSDMALEVFKEWLDATDAKNKVDYDIALVWTGFDIFGSSGRFSVAGYATTKVACNKNDAVAVVEFSGDQNTAITTAHEIAHSLGASHDGESNNCPPTSGYVETPISTARNKHRWEFSQCSAQYIANYINKLNAKGNCLTKTTARPDTYDAKTQSTRDIMDIHQTCKRALNRNDVYFCPFTNFYGNRDPNGDAICSTIYCGPVYSSACQTVIPPDGMMCGINKRCKQGKCVASPISTPANVKDESCLFGDVRSKFVGQTKYMTCKKYTDSKGPRQCESSYFRSQCCATCKTLETNIVGCMFGDKSPSCAGYKKRDPNICWSQKNRDVCCQTCEGYRSRRSVPEPLVKIEIMPDVVELEPTELPTIVDDDSPDLEKVSMD